MRNKSTNIEKRPNHVIVSSKNKAIDDKTVTILFVRKDEDIFTMSYGSSVVFMRIIYDYNTEINSVIGTKGTSKNTDSTIGRKYGNMNSVRHNHPKALLLLNYSLRFFKLIIKMALAFLPYLF